ncbi:hypothetical protein PVAP13_8KG281140 [Panicum virgatum]|uniref:Uncharacterized protein n=1 Tax=Panicum virgatum TaxID=38727 RepID=A0A8T0PV03_PANVG|nr:hypothetical protein PVAP13_8KG281140 [Panicum virgatum]
MAGGGRKIYRKRSEHARLQPRDKDGKFCSTSPSLGGRVKHSARAKARRASPSSGGVGRTGGQKSESESDGNSDAVTIPVVVLDDSDSGDDGDSASGDDRDSDLMEAQAMRKEFEVFKKEAKQKYNLAIQQRDEALAQRDEARMQCGVLEFDVEFLRTRLRMVITSSSKEDKVRLTSRYFRSKHKKKVSTTLGKSSSATSKKKKKEEVTSQGEIRKIWKLQSKIMQKK